MLRPLAPEVQERLRKADWRYAKYFWIFWGLMLGANYLGGLYWGEEEVQARYIKHAPFYAHFIFTFAALLVPILILKLMIKADKLEAKLDDLRSQFDDVIRHGATQVRETLEERERRADFYDDD